jgi:hypothetical protein
MVLVAVGVCAIASAVALAIFFMAGGPFGTINDVLNAGLALLSGYLAWRVSGHALLAYVALVSSLGFALIGLWPRFP